MVASSTSRASASWSSPGARRWRDADDRRADQRGPQHVHRGVGVERRREARRHRWRAAIAVTASASICCRNSKPSHCCGDLRHRSIHEHQLEVRRLLLARTRRTPTSRPRTCSSGLPVVGAVLHLVVEAAKAFLGEREEDVVLAGEVAVDGGGAVFDALGDLADRDVPIAFGDEEVARGVEDGRRGRPGVRGPDVL